MTRGSLIVSTIRTNVISIARTGSNGSRTTTQIGSPISATEKLRSYGYEYNWGAYAPLDTTNPEVRRYLLSTYFEPALRRGYRAIALNNVSVLNTDKRCGVWRGGIWTQLYSGVARDPMHTRDKLDYIRWVASEAHRRGRAALG